MEENKANLPDERPAAEHGNKNSVWVNCSDADFIHEGGCFVRPAWSREDVARYPSLASQFQVLMCAPLPGTDKVLMGLKQVDIDDYKDNVEEIEAVSGPLPDSPYKRAAIFAEHDGIEPGSDRAYRQQGMYSTRDDFTLSYEEAEKWCEELNVPIDKESVSENSRNIIDIHIRVNTATGTCRIQEKGEDPETYKISCDSDEAIINQISYALNLYLNYEEDEETVPTVSDDEYARFENLKSALFDAGTDAIEDFLGIDLSAPRYDGMGKDAIDNLMDQIYEEMPQEELEEFYARYLKPEEDTRRQWKDLKSALLNAGWKAIEEFVGTNLPPHPFADGELEDLLDLTYIQMPEDVLQGFLKKYEI